MTKAKAKTESIADLAARRDLLKEIDELASNYLATLRAIKETDAPTEDEMEAVESYYAALIAIEKSDAAPSEDEMKAASDHYATLKAIEEAEAG